MISGGPVYVSDKPSRHDPSLLARLALSDGRLLQPLLPGRPCSDSLFADVCGNGVSALKLWNMNACGGVLALFNVQVRLGQLCL
jgi:raffinose synthase